MLREHEYQHAADRLGVDLATVKAIAEVESAGDGFFPDGNVKTLFEGHHFYRLTKGKFADSHPDLCFPKWDRTSYGKTWQAERARFERAWGLDPDAALKSCSWGRFQIMGFNHKACGFAYVTAFADAMLTEIGQLMAFVAFVRSNPKLLAAAQARDWDDFARIYNGPGYAAPAGRDNDYDVKLERAHKRHAALTVTTAAGIAGASGAFLATTEPASEVKVLEVVPEPTATYAGYWIMAAAAVAVVGIALSRALKK
jgi:hypothetical protein